MQRDISDAMEKLAREQYAVHRGELRGRYTPGGDVEIMLPGTTEHVVMESTVFHENTHRYLFLNTTFGFVQQTLSILSDVENGLPKELKQNIDRSLERLWQASCLVHEGVATYRQYCYISAVKSKDFAESYVQQKPELYRSGFKLFSDAVKSARIAAMSDEMTALMLAEAALSTNIIDFLPDIINGKIDDLTNSVHKDSPNVRMTNIAESFVSGTNVLQTIPQKLLCSTENGLLPEESREFAKAWAILLSNIARSCKIKVYGVEDYPRFFSQRLRETTEALSANAKKNGFELTFKLNMAPENHEEAWAYVKETDANVRFVPQEFPILERNFYEQSAERVQEWCLKQLESLGANSVIYAHIFLPKRLLELPIDLEFEEDADKVLLLRSYSTEIYSHTELIVLLKENELPKVFSHPLLKNRIAISCALEDVFTDLVASIQEFVPNQARAAISLELLQTRTLFLYPDATRTFSYLKKLASRLIEQSPLEWGLVLSKHWRTTLIVFRIANGSCYIVGHCSEQGAIAFNNWAVSQGNRMKSSPDSGLLKTTPPEVLRAFCSHFIRFGY